MKEHCSLRFPAIMFVSLINIIPKVIFKLFLNSYIEEPAYFRKIRSNQFLNCWIFRPEIVGKTIHFLFHYHADFSNSYCYIMHFITLYIL